MAEPLQTFEARRHRLLLVEDNAQALRLLSLLARRVGYVFDTAVDGEQAYEMLLASPPDQYSAIVSDRMMPKLDGLALLQTVKAHSDYQHIPFILQTALSDSASIQEGIQAGAFYYLTKPLDLAVVESVLEAAVADFEAHKALRSELGTMADSLALMEQARFCYKTTAQAKTLAVLLSKLTAEPRKTVVGLYELMVNSVEHGNLGITYDEKTRLIANKTLLDEVERRAALPENLDKLVRVEVALTQDEMAVEIDDMGQGFAYQDYLQFSPERMMDNHGRGIMIANGVGFRQLEYRNGGRTVYCRIPR
jgi:CheY-like chemotaxis protein